MEALIQLGQVSPPTRIHTCLLAALPYDPLSCVVLTLRPAEELFLQSGESCLEHVRFICSERYSSRARQQSVYLPSP